MGRKSNKRKKDAGGEQPLEYEGTIGEKVKDLRAAMREEKLEEKILLKMAQAWEEDAAVPEALMQTLVNILSYDAGYGDIEDVMPVYTKVVAVINRAHEQLAEASQAETVLVSKVSSRVKKAPVRQTGGRNHRVKAGGHETSTTLGEALSLRPQLAKPRGRDTVDVLLWSGALAKAEQELKAEFSISKALDEYYHGMCKLGKSLLADELNKRTQRIYDVRASRQFVKEVKGLKRTKTEKL